MVLEWSETNFWRTRVRLFCTHLSLRGMFIPAKITQTINKVWLVRIKQGMRESTYIYTTFIHHNTLHNQLNSVFICKFTCIHLWGVRSQWCPQGWPDGKLLGWQPPHHLFKGNIITKTHINNRIFQNSQVKYSLLLTTPTETLLMQDKLVWLIGLHDEAAEEWQPAVSFHQGCIMQHNTSTRVLWSFIFISLLNQHQHPDYTDSFIISAEFRQDPTILCMCLI